MDDLFCCEGCGSSAVLLPRKLHSVNDVTCAGCGDLIGTLGELRARAERLAPIGRLNCDQVTHRLFSRL